MAAHPELDKRIELTRNCMKCGFCSFFCPTYQAELSESRGARGRQMYVRNVIKGRQELTHELADRVNTCTLCRLCEVNCPARAPTAELVMAARADLVQAGEYPVSKKAAFRLMLKNRKLMGLGIKWASWWQWTLPRTEGREGQLRHLPHFMEGLSEGRQIPQLAPKQLRQLVPEVTTPPPGVETRLKVGFFSGCSQEFLYAEQGAHLVNFLASQGCEVHFPRAQGCCGTPVVTSGDFDLGRELADQNVEAFRDFDIVISGCASCSSMLKEYEHTLADSAGRKERYAEFKAKIRNVTELLFGDLEIDTGLLKVKPEYRGKKVTWHDPCHLVRYQDTREEPRRILREAEGIEYVEMPNADRCCGMAGTLTIFYYDLSKKIGDVKARGIEASGADVVVTECPGCIMQLRDTVVRNDLPTPVVHILDLFE